MFTKKCMLDGIRWFLEMDLYMLDKSIYGLLKVRELYTKWIERIS